MQQQRQRNHSYQKSKMKSTRVLVTAEVSNKFVIPKREYNKQYSNIYFHRLRQLKASVTARARALHPELPVMAKLLDVQMGAVCIVVGTVYKRMQLQPSVLKEYAQERAILPMPVSASFTSDDDSLVLEDEFGRVPLLLPTAARSQQQSLVHRLVTGVVCALVGEEVDGGDFLVREFIEPACAPQKPLALLRDGEPRYLAFASDLCVGSASGEQALLLELLAAFLLSSPLAPHIARLVVAGNLIAPPSAANVELPSGSKALSHKSLSQFSVPVAAADTFVARICASLPLDVVPGARDPASYALPQQPLNMCLFPLSSHYASLTCSTNPYEATFDDGRVLVAGNGGQVLESMLRYVRDMTPLQAMRKCLEWRHVAPTAPDALACYPFVQRDRFVLTQTPHVLFVGDQNEYESELAELDVGPVGVADDDGAAATTATTTAATKAHVLLLRVPKFSTTGTIVLLDLNTMQPEPVTFEASF
jgi:DNA polymerase delta subunit 2